MTALTDEELDAMEAVAKAAMQGEWRAEIDNVFGGPVDFAVYVANCEPLGGPVEGTILGRANAAHIATFSPTRALQLIALARKAERPGWVLVPVEPTEAMIAAAGPLYSLAGYRAMLSALPQGGGE